MNPRLALSTPLLRLLAAVLLAAGLVPAAQRKPDLPQKYDRWLKEEVVYIITDEERKEFLQLKTDAERERFVQEFWEVRNPLRGSDRNPFREEHYRRIAYANEHFGRESNTPGWMTDMGRTYILFGKPQSAASFKGYGQIYPLELWFYSNHTGSLSLPPFFYVLFFLPEDIGEYRYYRPYLDGPLKLVRGSQFRTNRDVYEFLKPLGGDLAHAAFSLIPSEPLDTENFTVTMGSDMLVEKMRNFANDSFQVQRIREARYLRAKVTSWFLVMQDRPLEVSWIALADPGGRYWLDYAVWIDDPKLGQPDPDGSRLTVRASFRLLTQEGELILEDSDEGSYPAFEEVSGAKKFRPFLLGNRLPLVPGRYKLEVRIDNREASRSYHAERSIEVGGDGPRLLGPLLAAAAQAAKPDPAAPFQYFGVQFLPPAGRRLPARRPLYVLFQVQLPADPPVNYQVEYLVAHAQDREQRRSFVDTITPAELRDGRLLKSKTLPLADWPPGAHRLVLSLRREGSAEVLAAASVPFQIEDAPAPPPLDFLAHARTMADPGVAAYLRGLQALAQRDEQNAAEYFRQALERSPANDSAGRALTRIYFHRGEYGRIAELYRRLGPGPLRGAPESLAQVAVSLWQTGEQKKAREVLAEARSQYPQDAVLAAVSARLDQAAAAPSR